MKNYRYKIMVLLPLNAQQQKLFCDAAQDVVFDFCTNCEPTNSQINEADIIFGNPPPSSLRNAPKLKWLQLITAGADAYMGKGILNDNVLVTSASGAYGEAQSEFILALLLSLCKKLHIYRDNQSHCIWRDEGDELMLCSSTALIIGLGNIGTSFAKKLKAFGTYVIGLRKSNLQPCEYADELYTIEDLEKLLPRADIISLSLPATPQTRHLLNEKMFNLVKPGAVFINTGRGSTVDTDALCLALEQNRLGGAALDVMEEEPLPPSHRLWKMQNVIITPHIAGRDFLPCTFDKTIAIILSNLKAYLGGDSMKNMVK